MQLANHPLPLQMMTTMAGGLWHDLQVSTTTSIISFPYPLTCPHPHSTSTSTPARVSSHPHTSIPHASIHLPTSTTLHHISPRTHLCPTTTLDSTMKIIVIQWSHGWHNGYTEDLTMTWMSWQPHKHDDHTDMTTTQMAQWAHRWHGSK